MSQTFRIKITVDTPLENAAGRMLRFIERFLRNHSWHDTLSECKEGMPIYKAQLEQDERTNKGFALKQAWVKHYRACNNCSHQGPFRTINHTNYEDIRIELEP